MTSLSTALPPEPVLDVAATEALHGEVESIRSDETLTVFEQQQRIARLLGAHFDPDTGRTRFGFWAPELAEARVSHRRVTLEIFTPTGPIDLTAERLATTFRRTELELHHDGEHWWGVVDGVVAGDATRCGALYWLRAVDEHDDERVVHDVLAHSLPYGSFAPAEVYDVVSLQRSRSDLDHFAAEPPVPTSILELHVPTATAEGTVGALAEVYERIGALQRAGEPLPDELQVYAGYDAIQPLPVDPTIERRAGAPTFSVTDVIDELDGVVGVLLRHPENQNWGYDNIVASSSATNPSLLGTRRPAELVRLAEALHALPEPMMLIYDVVYGHADNQALDVLPSRFFKGPNMYGQDLNHQDPSVRAILLEMLRRRVDTGCDGVRVDGAQDFKFYDPRSGQVEYDDDYLREMSEVPQEIGRHRRRVWMIFEDGRPWPAEGWETSSTYRDVVEQQPDVFQWGPLIFAHNTPMLDGFWSEKWWRVEQVAEHGGHWISGCANHDTVRRGTQVDPMVKPINAHLGTDLPTVLDSAYDNPGVTAVSYGLLPGVPMDFLNATTHAPWGFMRTTDDLYGPKVMSEEGGFLEWQIHPDDFARPEVFHRVKRHGFSTRDQLRAFLAQLSELVEATDYDLDEIAAQIRGPEGLRPGRDGLHLLAFDFMRDVHDVCNVGPHLGELDHELVVFGATMRDLRRARPWLRDDFRPDDHLELVEGQQAIYRGHRRAPTGDATVAVVANMAGAPIDLRLGEACTVPVGPSDVTIASPGADLDGDQVRLVGGSALLVLGA